MGSIRTPQEKKRLSYDRDRRVRGGESDKAFRKAWPIKKRKANRAFRRQAEVMTHSTKLDPDAETDVRIIKRGRLVKWGVTKLRDDVARKQKRRAESFGAKKARRRKRPMNPSSQVVGKAA